METKRFSCLNCGERFELQVFEKGEAERKRQKAYPAHCPACKRTDLRSGWGS